MINDLKYYGGSKTVHEGDYTTWPNPCEEDLTALKRVVNGEKYHRVNNPIVAEFEKKLKKWSGFAGCRAINSGTSAIHIGMGYFSNKHKNVIVSALNWPGAVAPVYMAGMNPVYVDVDIKNACLDETSVLQKLNDGSANLVLATHLFGNVSYLDNVRKLMADNDYMDIFDDCSQGMDISRMFATDKKSCYTSGIAFSGNGAKHLASGELGVLLTMDKELIAYVDYISLSSSSRNGDRFFSPFTKGYNFRPNVFSCAVAISRLSSLKEQLNVRKKNVLYLNDQIKDLTGLKPLFNKDDENSNYYGAHFRICLEELGLPTKAAYRDFIVKLLYEEGVPISVWLKRPAWEYIDYKRTNCDIMDFPCTKLLLDTMFYITEVAGPNTEYTMNLFAQAIKKVWNFIENNTDFIISDIKK